ncbi:MAG: hypothetical protein P1P86_11830 [Bacteroidales bacterium]|nr:hypothetical protein [Bacteroidales bacterium]
MHVSRIVFLPALLIFIQQLGFSQPYSANHATGPSENLRCGELISTYREFFKYKEYILGKDAWWTLFHEFPGESERLYVDGVTMYRHFIEDAPDGPWRDARIDTLMLIYDQRMAHFGGEGNILGRKGCDLLRYRSADKDQLQSAYGMLKQSLEIQGARSLEVVMLNYMAAGLKLNQAAIIENSQVLEDYLLVTGLLDQQE